MEVSFRRDLPFARKTKMIVRLLMVLTVLIFTSSIAHAVDIPWSGSDGQGNTWDLGEFADQLKTIYTIFSNISLPCGAVSFAFGAYKLMLGDERLKEPSKGKKQMQLSILAVVAIQVLPAVISFAFSLVSGYQWDPFNP